MKHIIDNIYTTTIQYQINNGIQKFKHLTVLYLSYLISCHNGLLLLLNDHAIVNYNTDDNDSIDDMQQCFHMLQGR